MITCGNSYGVRLDGDLHIKWFDTRVEAERYEFERLWAPHIRRARLLGRRIILPADVARQAEVLMPVEEGK